MKISKIAGIDLGAAKCQFSIAGDGDGFLTRTLPCVVSWDAESGEIVVGARALGRRGFLPEPAAFFKGKMGTQETFELAGRLMTPEELTALVLAECRQLMEDELNENSSEDRYTVDRAVVTIPADYTLSAVESLRKAAETAGIKIVEFLQEPTAAVIYYFHKYGITSGAYLVYDLGASTFNVSIVRMLEGIPMVIGIGGNNYVGGYLFDRELARDILSRMKEYDENYALDLDLQDESDRMRLTKLILDAECIKRSLSYKEELYWDKKGIFTDKNGAVADLSMEFQRSDFNDLIWAHIMSTIAECEKALEQADMNAGITIENIDGIILTGGSVKIPLVSDMVKFSYLNSGRLHAKCLEPVILEPDTAPGFGAAIRARKLESTDSEEE